MKPRLTSSFFLLSSIAGLLAIATPARLLANQPEWWTQPLAGGPPVVDRTAEKDNLGAATVGQGKWMAVNAIAALEKELGPDSPTVRDIKAELFKSTENDPHGVFFPDRPKNPSAEWVARQHAPLQIGGLKALSAPFYKHLAKLDPAWLQQQFKQNGMATEGKDYFRTGQQTAPIFFPWNPADDKNSEKNGAPAVIGQVKAMFSLRFEQLSPRPWQLM